MADELNPVWDQLTYRLPTSKEERHRQSIRTGIDVLLTGAEVEETANPFGQDADPPMFVGWAVAWAALNKLFGRAYCRTALGIDGPPWFYDHRFDTYFRLIETHGEPYIPAANQSSWDGKWYSLPEDVQFVSFSLPRENVVTFHGWFCVGKSENPDDDIEDADGRELNEYLEHANIGPDGLIPMSYLVNEARNAIAECRSPRFANARADSIIDFKRQPFWPDDRFGF